jgi:hypothetical protein
MGGSRESMTALAFFHYREHDVVRVYLRTSFPLQIAHSVAYDLPVGKPPNLGVPHFSGSSIYFSQIKL